LKQLTRALHRRGDRVFSLSLHSPSAGIGYTPYVRSVADRDRLFATIDAYISWFRNELGGITTTPTAILAEVIG
jgi:teichuronic acid biosynthesis glycosyltransferase TuaC